MKKMIILTLAVILIMIMSGCGEMNSPAETTDTNETATMNPARDTGNQPVQTAENEKQTEETPAAENETTTAETEISAAKTLVVVFSATGTTKGVAEKIAAIENADLYEILAAEPYSSADLNWNDKNSRTTIEMNDPNARPEIGSEEISLDGYKTVYIGYPIWWGDAPRIMSTFVESHDFEGITVIPFCTSSSSGIGRSGQNLAENAGSGNWLEGKRFSGSVSEADLQAWIDSLK